MTRIWCRYAPLLIVMLTGCDNGQKEIEAAQLRQASMENMVSIPGGRFQMGDFGPLVEALSKWKIMKKQGDTRLQ